MLFFSSFTSALFHFSTFARSSFAHSFYFWPFFSFFVARLPFAILSASLFTTLSLLFTLRLHLSVRTRVIRTRHDMYLYTNNMLIHKIINIRIIMWIELLERVFVSFLFAYRSFGCNFISLVLIAAVRLCIKRVRVSNFFRYFFHFVIQVYYLSLLLFSIWLWNALNTVSFA